MEIQNADVDYCGIINLLKQLVAKQVCTVKEAKKVAARIAVQLHTSIILPLDFAEKN